ncbi:hypothetical protein F5Y17DRAFT_453400 [Xylariaceae sp. FL0594]|nr:hypothetical protein F5Y17DRAFT_453400 [Xylariaceae sp. FL0594]
MTETPACRSNALFRWQRRVICECTVVVVVAIVGFKLHPISAIDPHLVASLRAPAFTTPGRTWLAATHSAIRAHVLIQGLAVFWAL